MRRILYQNGLSLALFGLFVVCVVGQSLAGHRHYNKGRQAHGQPAVSYRGYLHTGHFVEALAENWESEFLQMSTFVLLTIFLRQQGSPESKQLDAQEAIDTDPRHVTRQLRWWRGVAGGLLALALLTWMLPVTTAQEDSHSGWRGPPECVAALEQKLRHVTSVTDAEGRPEVVITGANLHIVNGLGNTDCADEENEEIPDCPNGLGNLIVGYNEPRVEEENIRTGSHNVVVGQEHNFSRFGGLVVGRFNTISGEFAVVSGGERNTASGEFAVVSAGLLNRARSNWASISGGSENVGDNIGTSISGGNSNTANGISASVSGGSNNVASGGWSTVSGGQFRSTDGDGDFDWVAGSLVEDQ